MGMGGIRLRRCFSCVQCAGKCCALMFVESFLHREGWFARYPATWCDPSTSRTSPGCEVCVFHPHEFSAHNRKVPHKCPISNICGRRKSIRLMGNCALHSKPPWAVPCSVRHLNCQLAHRL